MTIPGRYNYGLVSIAALAAAMLAQQLGGMPKRLADEPKIKTRGIGRRALGRHYGPHRRPYYGRKLNGVI